MVGISVPAWSIPARRGLRSVKQPDGTELQVRLAGDEFHHYYVDVEGRMLLQDAEGYYRVADELQAEAARLRGIARRGRRNAGITRAAAENVSQVPHIGSPRVPVILVQYKDVKFKDSNPKATFENFFAKGDVSAFTYFKDQSRGQFTPQFDVYGPYTLSKNRRTYGGNDWEGYDKGVGKMVAEGCNGLNNQIDFSKYDNDGDGECDVVIVLYAGDGEASSSDWNAEDAIWPCQWGLEESDYGKSLKLDNTKVDLFAVFNELNGANLSKIDGIGTFCHEFSHCLGLPDFYDTQYGPHFGMANWSLMDYGSYNDDGYTPIGYSAYEKEFMGWLNIPEARENTAYTLAPLGQPYTEDMAVKLTNPRDPDEYYILEARKKDNWDEYMPAEGLLITHFTYDASVWMGNTVNDEDMQRATIIPADNSLKMDKEEDPYYGETYYQVNEQDLLGDLWPYKNATELTDSSVPAAKVNTGGYMGKPVTDIVRNDDGSVSFIAMKSDKPTGVDAIEAAEGEMRWFTLQGVALPERPTLPGIYVCVDADGTSHKRIIR
ncbi:MAG: M6 family metalloprotease domain-containing protein [Muribaculaceae bacterium]|nr:M6 family metalloprotease domain-containing protein [Muribaculaceae bacterium]